jgi:hypothetical protein
MPAVRAAVKPGTGGSGESLADEEVADKADQKHHDTHLEEDAETREILANLVHGAALAGFHYAISLFF